MADPTNTLSVSLTPITPGTPNIYDDKLQAAIDSAKAGGTATQQYFDSANQTADYWGWFTSTQGNGEDPWAPGTDPDGNPIEMSSNGNLDMRMGAFYRASADGLTAEHLTGDGPPPIVGIATIQTHNTTSNVSADITFGLGLTGIPAGIVLSKALFGDLIKPVYSNLKTAVGKLAETFKQEAEVTDPSIDPEDTAEDPLEEASGVEEQIGGDLAEEGAEYLTIEWGSVVLEGAGLGAIMAIPMIVSFLGHKMINSVVINNLTDTDFEWQLLSQVHGKASVLPSPDSKNVIPKMDYNVDSWGDKTTVKVAYEAQFQFINSSDLGSIGYVLSLAPTGGGKTAKVAVAVPWAGDNGMWVGSSDDDPGTIYEENTDPDGLLSKSATFGDYTVTMGINALHGETEGAYFYGLIVAIEKA
ncbi:hypothetical protein [Antribacter gilvus]|uniref:hypothetical protein n=1 Tax=Antribacter gilvus TaxID=2304675 RepID=UPI000F789B46|nr:hypothetical protein [Antribacter gilvus]